MIDDHFDALADEQRREVLLAILERNPRDDRSVTTAVRTDAERARTTELHHVHLPKLEDYGLIDWDRERHEIVKGPLFDQIRPLLVLLDENRDELVGSPPTE